MLYRHKFVRTMVPTTGTVIRGVCPQYWKYKGGNTYVFPDVSIAVASNKDDAFYSIIQNNLTSADDYYEEYIVGEETRR